MLPISPKKSADRRCEEKPLDGSHEGTSQAKLRGVGSTFEVWNESAPPS
jgi:hypothetical protein